MSGRPDQVDKLLAAHTAQKRVGRAHELLENAETLAAHAETELSHVPGKADAPVRSLQARARRIAADLAKLAEDVEAEHAARGRALKIGVAS